MRWSYPSVASIRSSPFSPAFLRSKTYGSMARNALFDAHRTQVDKSATIVVKKRHTHNNLLLTDAGRRVLALSPTQPGAPVSGSESGSSMPSAASNAWPPSPNPIETTPPRWKTNSCWLPVAHILSFAGYDGARCQRSTRWDWSCAGAASGGRENHRR